MKLLIGAMLAALALAAEPAAAGPWHNFGSGLFHAQAQRQRQGGFQGGFRRQPQRDFRREAPPERGQRGDDRMTEEERRGLRRDLDRANREIYKGRQ